MDSLKDKTIVVTGSNGLIGVALLHALKENMSNIIAIDIAYNDADSLSTFIDEFNYKNILYFDTNIADEKELESSINKGFEKFGSIDGLVNCAAIDSVPDTMKFEPIEDLSIEKLKNSIEVNLSSQIVCTKIVGDIMKKNSIKGSIVNIGSIYGMVSPKQNIYSHIEKEGEIYKKPISYGVSKSGLMYSAKYFSTYWEKSEIRINNIVLGGVFNNQDKKFVENYSKNVPLGRMANKGECIPPILFLLGDGSSYITGSDLYVDGGWTAW